MGTTVVDSGKVSAPGQAGKPTQDWDPEAKRRQMKISFRILVVLVAAVWVGLIAWVFVIAPIVDVEAKELDPGASLTLVLAPVLVAAAGVERMLETLFNIIEGAWKSLVAYLGRGLLWLKNAETEVMQSRQWLADVSTRYKEEMSAIRIGQGSIADLTQEALERMATANAMMEMAERRLADAERTLSSVTDSSSYKSAKAAASIVLGLMLGVVVAALGSLQMFALLGIGAVPPRIDVLVTGLIIGSGAYPVHSLVGILQQAKDTLDSAKGYLQSRSAPREMVTTRVAVQAPARPVIEGQPAAIQQAVVETISEERQPDPPKA